jgi:hypothetical protein
MNQKSKELDVDFIGGEGPMTREEENAIREFLLAQKQNTPDTPPIQPSSQPDI